jgi:two-component system, cell cycle response regulator
MEKDKEYSREHILIVDDEIDICASLTDLLSAKGFKTDTAENGKTALNKIRKNSYTFLLTDITMPELNGIDLIKAVKRERSEISIIAMTGYDKTFTYMDVVNAGANDFLIKPFKIDEIEAKIKRIIIERDIREKLAKLSITDSLTGLFNQRHFNYKLKEEVKRAKRQNRPLSLALLDLDHFKDYNDNFGHLEGDNLLSKAGKLILSHIRENVDIAFRYGGDEFAIILVDADAYTAKFIRDRLEKGFEGGCDVKASIGVATYSKDMDLKEFIALADSNLYKAKKMKKVTK